MPEHRYIETNIDKKNDSANNLLVPRRSAPGIASVPQIRPMQNRACDGASPDSGPQATRTERTENGAFSSVLAANWHWDGRDGARPSAEYKSSVDRNMKTIALIGASGFVGSAILKEALYRDLQVTAIVRRPESIALRSLNLETRTADAADPTTLREAVRNHDAVISAYNPGRNNPDIYEQTLSVYPRIVEAVKLAGIKRLLVVGGAGSLYVGPGMRLLDSGRIPERLLPGVKALAEVYETVLKPENELDWVFFSPAAELVPGQADRKIPNRERRADPGRLGKKRHLGRRLRRRDDRRTGKAGPSPRALHDRILSRTVGIARLRSPEPAATSVRETSRTMESKSGESPALPADSTPLAQFFKTFAPKKRFRRAKQANIPRGKVPAETVPAHKRPETNERMHGTDRREAPTPEISRPASPSLPPAARTGAGPPTDRRPAGSGYATRFRFRNPRRTARRSSARRAKRYPRPKRQRTAAACRAAKPCRRSACR